MVVDPVGLQGMKDKTKEFLSNIDINDISRKTHNKILYQLASHFRSLRTINHKQILVK